MGKRKLITGIAASLKQFPWQVLTRLAVFSIVLGLLVTIWQQINTSQLLVAEVGSRKSTQDQLLDKQSELEAKLSEDPYAENERLRARQEAIHQAIDGVSSVFESRADLIALGGNPSEVEPKIVELLAYLNQEKYEETEKTAKIIVNDFLALTPTPKPVAKETASPTVTSLGGSGYQRVNVATSRGSFTIAILEAPGARAIVDTASDSDCQNDCPVIPLAEYVSRNGGFAGINGAYFCPADYSSCAGKVNSFDTLAVNGRTKAVLNRDNNVYSTVPLAAMYGGSISFYSQTVQWGVDTSGTGALANYPMLLNGGNYAFDEGSLPAYLRDTKGTRGFIGTKDGGIVIGHVFAANIADTAEVLKTLGVQNALNLDGGGSSALYVDGAYRVGPGRLLPTAIVLVR